MLQFTLIGVPCVRVPDILSSGKVSLLPVAYPGFCRCVCTFCFVCVLGGWGWGWETSTLPHKEKRPGKCTRCVLCILLVMRLVACVIITELLAINIPPHRRVPLAIEYMCDIHTLSIQIYF